MGGWKTIGIASLIFWVLFSVKLSSEAQESESGKGKFSHLSEVEIFSVSLTFDVGAPPSEIFRKASFEFVNEVVNLLPLIDGVKVEMSKVSPDEFLSRLSIQRRIPTKEGKIEYRLSAYVDVRKLLFFISSQQTSVLADIRECAELTPFLKKALFEFSASATLTCTLKREGRKSPIYPNNEIIRIDGVVFSDRKIVPISLSKEFLFFSIPAYHEFYEELRNIFSKNFPPKYKKRDYMISAKKDKFDLFMSSVSKKSYFIAIIPKHYERRGDSVKSKVEFLYFPVIKDDAIEDLVINELEKVQGVIIE